MGEVLTVSGHIGMSRRGANLVLFGDFIPQRTWGKLRIKLLTYQNNSRKIVCREKSTFSFVTFRGCVKGNRKITSVVVTLRDSYFSLFLLGLQRTMAHFQKVQETVFVFIMKLILDKLLSDRVFAQQKVFVRMASEHDICSIIAKCYDKFCVLRLIYAYIINCINEN